MKVWNNKVYVLGPDKSLFLLLFFKFKADDSQYRRICQQFRVRKIIKKNNGRPIVRDEWPTLR